MWAESFIKWGRPTYQIVQLSIKGNYFIGDANNCFEGQLNKEKNLSLAVNYWENYPNIKGEAPIKEMLVNGDIEVIEIVETINANL